MAANAGAGYNEFIRQSGTYINLKIQEYYVLTGPLLSSAVLNHFQGNKKEENRKRRIGIEYFIQCLSLSENLPNIRKELDEVKNKDFKDTADLQKQLFNALTGRTPSTEIYDKWRVYSYVLVKSGLIKVLDKDDNPYNKFRR